MKKKQDALLKWFFINTFYPKRGDNATKRQGVTGSECESENWGINKNLTGLKKTEKKGN